MTKKEQKQQAHSWAWPVRVVVGVLAGVMAFGIAKYFLSHSSTQRYSQPVQIYNHQPVTSDAGSSSGLESRITLEQARRDSSLRQIYIDQIAAGISLPYLEGIVYDHDGSKLLEQTYQDLIKQGVDQQVITFIMTQRKQQLGDGSYAAMTPHPHFTRGRKESSTIFMGRRIFEGNAHEIEEDVIATVYHESRHAVQSGEGLPLDYLLGDVKHALYSEQIRLDSFEIVGELDAYHFIFEKLLEGNLRVSKTYFEAILKNYAEYLGLLQQRRGETTSALEIRFIEAALDQVKDLPVSLLNYDQVK